MLLAWDKGAGAAKLVGVWALRLRRMVPFWPLVLEALPYNYAFLSSPVVDPAYVNEVIPAFFAAIEKSPVLPDIVSLPSLDAECPSYPAMLRELAARGVSPLVVSESARPFVTREFGVKRSGSTRKKLRQDWNRLTATGAVEVVNDRTPDGVEGNLAAQGNASVALLRLDGEAIAAQVLMYCGATAYTWKTAFSAAFAKFSPGALLIDKITEELFSGPDIMAINSCAAEASYMAQLWAGRRTTVDMLVDVGSGNSFGFQLEAARQLGYQQLRNWRDRVRHRPSAPVSMKLGKKLGTAASR